MSGRPPKKTPRPARVPGVPFVDQTPSMHIVAHPQGRLLQSVDGDDLQLPNASLIALPAPDVRGQHLWAQLQRALPMAKQARELADACADARAFAGKVLRAATDAG